MSSKICKLLISRGIARWVGGWAKEESRVGLRGLTKSSPTRERLAGRDGPLRRRPLQRKDGDIKSPQHEQKPARRPAQSQIKVLRHLCRRGLDNRLIADGHNPFASTLDPQTSHMDGFASVGLMQAHHDYRVAEIKHLRGNERGRRCAASGLLLQIQRGDTIGFGERMIVGRAEHGELFGNVRGPGGCIVIGDADLQRLPGSDDSLLGFILRLVRESFARILAIRYARARWGGLLTAESDFVIDEQTPGRATLNPEAENMDLVAIGHDRFHLTARLTPLVRASFVAESGRGGRTKKIGAGQGLAIVVGPGEIRVEELSNGGAFTLGSSLDKFAVGLKSRGFVGRGSSAEGKGRKEEATKQNSRGEHTNNETPHDSRSSLDFPIS